MKVFYIDYENVKNDGIKGIEYLTQNDEVIVFCSSQSPKRAKIESALKKSVASLLAKISFVNVEVGGKNAIDFQLVAHLYKNYEKGREYYIVSEDKDYDFSIGFMNGDAPVKRISSILQIADYGKVISAKDKEINSLKKQIASLEKQNKKYTVREHSKEELSGFRKIWCAITRNFHNFDDVCELDVLRGDIQVANKLLASRNSEIATLRKRNSELERNARKLEDASKTISDLSQRNLILESKIAMYEQTLELSSENVENANLSESNSPENQNALSPLEENCRMLIEKNEIAVELSDYKEIALLVKKYPNKVNLHNSLVAKFKDAELGKRIYMSLSDEFKQLREMCGKEAVPPKKAKRKVEIVTDNVLNEEIQLGEMQKRIKSYIPNITNKTCTAIIKQLNQSQSDTEFKNLLVERFTKGTGAMMYEALEADFVNLCKMARMVKLTN